MGYADKSMIAKIEKGLVDLPQSKIIAFAEALHVSPGDLMGWELSDSDIANAFISDDLGDIIDNIQDFSPYEKPHFKSYLHLLEINRKKVDDYTNQLLSLQQMETDVQLNAAQARTDIDVPEGTDTSDDDIMNDKDF